MPSQLRLLFAMTALAFASVSQAGTNAWTYGGIPQGPIFDIAVHPADPSIVLAGGNRDIFRSTDGGQTWTTSTFEGLNYVTALAFDRSNPSRVIAMNGQLFLSNDTGQTFAQIMQPISTVVVSAANFGADGVLYIGYFNGRTFKAPAPFTGWIEITTPWTGSISDIETSASAPQTLFVAVANSGIWRSTNGGTNWTGPLNSGFATSSSGLLNDVAISKVNPSHVFVAHSGGIHRSQDNGDTWTQVDGWPTSSIALDPNDGNIVLGIRGGSPLIRSTDGGDNFINFGVPTRANGLPVAEFIGSSTRVLFGTTDGLSLSTDAGATRNYSTTGITGGQPGQIVRADDGTVIVGQLSGFNDIFRRTASGYVPLANSSTYSSSITGVRQLTALAISPTNSNVLMAVNSAWQLVRTTDGGATFSLPAPTFTSATWPDVINDVTIAPDNADVAYVTKAQTGIWKTINGGTTYTRLLQSPNWVTTVGVHPADTSVLYASGGPDNGSGLYKSSDGGATWTETLAPTPSNTPNGFTVYRSFVFHPELPGTVYAVGWGGVRKTVNGGATWALVDFGHPVNSNPAATALFIDPVMPSTIIMLNASGAGGFLRSVDDGVTWTETPLGAPGLVNYVVNGVLLEAGSFIAGTNRLGIAEYTIAPDVQLTLPDTPVLPQSANYQTTLTIRNQGAHAASPSEVTVTRPEWLTPTVPAGCTATALTFRCPVTALAPGASATLPLQFAVTAPTTGNQLSIALATHEIDPVAANNRIERTVTAAVLHDLDVTVTAPASLDTGAAVDVVAVLVNRGPSPAAAAQIAVSGLGSFVVESATASAGTCTSGATTSCVIGAMAPDTSVTVTLRLRGNTPGAFDVVTAATAGATDSDNDQNTATRSITVRTPPVANPNPGGGGGGGSFGWLALTALAMAAALRRRTIH
jgi:photosystem II stability/assembly factor-like uncharacterized protein